MEFLKRLVGGNEYGKKKPTIVYQWITKKRRDSSRYCLPYIFIVEAPTDSEERSAILQRSAKIRQIIYRNYLPRLPRKYWSIEDNKVSVLWAELLRPATHLIEFGCVIQNSKYVYLLLPVCLKYKPTESAQSIGRFVAWMMDESPLLPVDYEQIATLKDESNIMFWLSSVLAKYKDLRGG